MIKKLGQFLLLFSVILVFLFIASDVTGRPDYWIFLGGFSTLVFGIILLRKAHEYSNDKPRFRMLRRLLNRKANKGD